MYALTELIRLLEQQGFVFSKNPQAITARLRHTDGDFTSKLYQRAQQLDDDHRLQQKLHKIDSFQKLLIHGLSILWLAIGFGSVYGLMQPSGLNFLWVLMGILGLNTLTLFFWLLLILIKKPVSKSWLNPALWLRGSDKDATHHALVRFYAEQTTKPAFLWQSSLLSHRLWLSALIGMGSSALLLLTVRQYSFNWESTLLGNQSFVQILSALAWLPKQFGFAVPDTQAILHSRSQLDTHSAVHWGGLLLGSIFCYGLLPRALAWFFCWYKSHRSQSALDLTLPYYQNIVRQWRRNIVDADDFQALPVPISQNNTKTNHTNCWAILLDAPDTDSQWYQGIEELDWQDQGLFSEREQVNELLQQLANQDIYLLVGIRANVAPDRGILRRLDKLAQSAQSGITIKLLNTEENQELTEQWQTALQQRAIAFVQ